MLFLRACPHCHGDLAFEQDRACGYLECVQCGHVLSTAQERALGVRVSRLGIMRAAPPPRGERRPGHHPVATELAPAAG